MPILDSLVTEMKTRPFSMTMMLGLYALVILTIFTNYGLASEPQVQGIAAQVQAAAVQVAALANTVKKTSIDGRLDQKRAELFTWQQKVSDLQKAGKPVDQLYASHIVELQNEIDDLQKQRDALR